MKPTKIIFILITALLVATATATAGDFGWTDDFNIQAQADPSGFRARLATRFRIGAARVEAVLSNVGSPADAYIVLSLGEMSGRPVDYVVEQYNHDKGKGWGALAKSLGIKPGSEEFHALKSGRDLRSDNNSGHAFFSFNVQDDGKDENKAHGKGKGGGKDNKKK